MQRSLLRWTGLLLSLALWAAPACKSYPTRPIVSAIALSEEPTVGYAAEVREGLATAESPRFLLLWDNVAVDYEEYDADVLARDLERIERYYRARGYYSAKVTVARVLHQDDHHVRIEIAVSPGPVVRLTSVTPRGIASLPFDLIPEVTRALHGQDLGQPFDEGHFEDTKRALEETLQNRGFAFAKVEGKAKVDIAHQRADVEFNVVAGARARYGEIRIDGLHEIPEKPVRDNLRLRAGQIYARAELEDARKALINLGVFSSVEIHQDLSQENAAVVPIQVVVHEASLRTLRFGGGSRFDVLRLNVHLRAGWENLNLLGGMRHFSIDAAPGFTLFPTRLDRWNNLRRPTRVLLESSLKAELRQPALFEGRTTGVLSSSYAVAPLLYPLPVGVDPDAERIVGYQRVTLAAGAQRAFFRHHVYIESSYNWQANFPFSYQGAAPDPLQNVRVAFPELITTLDLRDDPIQPHQGIFVSNSLQVADKIFGGNVSDLRVQPEIRTYVPIDRRVTLATRVAFGFLFPRDYGSSLTPGSSLPATDPNVIRDQQKLLFRAFYSGGPNSNRGYSLRGVGPSGPVGFLIPTGVNCDGGSTAPGCVRPLGGFTLWEASLEIRFGISGPVNGLLFADTSNVTRETGRLSLNRPHLSVGPGLRYMTPVGPLRLDIGYRVPGLQAIGESELPENEGRETGTLFGISWLPVAVNIAIGEAF